MFLVVMGGCSPGSPSGSLLSRCQQREQGWENQMPSLEELSGLPGVVLATQECAWGRGTCSGKEKAISELSGSGPRRGWVHTHSPAHVMAVFLEKPVRSWAPSPDTTLIHVVTFRHVQTARISDRVPVENKPGKVWFSWRRTRRQMGKTVGGKEETSRQCQKTWGVGWGGGSFQVSLPQASGPTLGNHRTAVVSFIFKYARLQA